MLIVLEDVYKRQRENTEKQQNTIELLRLGNNYVVKSQNYIVFTYALQSVSCHLSMWQMVTK